MLRHEAQNAMAKRRYEFLSAQKKVLDAKAQIGTLTSYEHRLQFSLNQQIRSLRVNFQF